MNITEAQYILGSVSGENAAIKVVIDGRHLSVPLDPANTDYTEIMQQVDAGTLTIEDAD